ncbi:hypothetical protein FOQG_02311 [Fusarium oxysporum f. sp. raphani 54005]|uniref:Uncharacterized protein n=1 Tax=Fusarium oxysporum f. sp. raphani 54005 TaxID=1089458 RepID=X0CRZ1_FUSOX|nr:hypothetical protein FOQG_02311 [Fusarium oxysporum f. sp. raphani 54005]
MKDRRPRYGKFRGEVKNCERDWSFKLSEAVVKDGVVRIKGQETTAKSSTAMTCTKARVQTSISGQSSPALDI